VDVTIEHQRAIFGRMTATPKKEEAPRIGGTTPAKADSSAGGN
jgi:hypothetical protein